MNKYILCLAAALSLGAFTACEDVPAPYGINNSGNNNGGDNNGGNTGETKTIFAASFDTGADDFTFQNVTLGEGLTYVWKQDSYNGKGYLKASAYANSKSNPSEAWAVSPAINLSDCTEATLNFRQAINKITPGIPAEMYSVWASTDYAGDVNTATWTQLNVPSFPEGNSWTFSDAGAIDLAAFCGKQNVRIAYKYTSTSEASGTWEVDEFTITGNGTPMNNGGGGTPDTPDQPSAPTGTNLIVNGGFESWSDGKCDGWKSTTSASNATVSQSTTAHSGQYAIMVAGNESSNKRLGSKEYKLNPGTYTISMYVKGAGQVKLGYAVVGDDGKIANGDSYNYSNYVTTTDEWTLVTYEFTLEAATTVNFVVMNPKTSNYAATSDKLIDDFSVVTSNGGIAASAIHRVRK